MAGTGISPFAAAAAAAVLTKKRHGAAGVERGAAFIPFLLSGEAVAVENPLQGGFHHPAAGVRNQQNLRSTLRAAAAARRSQNGAGADARIYTRRHRRPRPYTQA